jgi:hypothetical protein
MSKSPSWDRWLNFSDLEIWEAVALSLDLDPDLLPVDWRPVGGGPFDDCPREFCDRLQVAVRSIGDPLRITSLRVGDVVRSKVRLSEFVGWATTLPRPWSLPADFASIKPMALTTAPPTNEVSASAPPAGLTPQQIAEAFGVIDGAQQIKLKGWGRNEWLNAFQDGRAKWIKELKLSDADKPKQIAAMFDPLGVAKVLIDKFHTPVPHVRRAFSNPLLKPWKDEFERYLITTADYR